MAEKNYTTLIRKLKELRSICSHLDNYDPVQDFIKLSSIDKKITLIEKLNREIDQLESQLNLKRQNRIRKIKGLSEKHGINGIIRLSRQAVNYVGAFGKEYYPEQQMLKNLIFKMQPKGGTVLNGNGNGSALPQSYEAITNAAEQFYLILKDIPVYNPADKNISKASFNEKVQEVKQLTGEINRIYEKLRPMIKQRYDEYHSKDIGVRKLVTEVKKYIRGNWGINSNQYKSIKDLKI